MTWRWVGVVLVAVIATAAAIISVATNAQQPQSVPIQPQGHRHRPANAASEAPPAAKPANIDRNGVLMLVRSTLLALDQANKTGNYTVLRDLGVPGFRPIAQRSWPRFLPSSGTTSSIFPASPVIDPTDHANARPEIEPNGMMRMSRILPVGTVAGQF